MKRLSLVALIAFMAVNAFAGTAWNRQDAVTASWTSSSAAGSALSISVVDFATVVVSVSSSGITDGSIAFEASDDSSNWYRVSLVRLSSATPELFSGLAGADSRLRLWQGNVAGFQKFRVRIVGPITGSGTASVRIGAQAGPISPVVSSVASVDPTNGWELLNMYLLKRNRLR